MVLALLVVLGVCGVTGAQSSPTFQITGATYGTGTTSSTTGNASIPAGVAGGTFQLTGTLPTAGTQAQNPVSACFYTGYGSTSTFPISLPNGSNTEPLVVPASTIQSIPATAFVPTNNYTVTGYLYFVSSGSGACSGTYDTALTNRFGVSIVAPSLKAYGGPVSIPKTNAAAGTVSPPTFLTLPAGGVLASGQYGSTAATKVSFGTFGSVSTDLSSNVSSLHVAVPAALSSSPVGTTAALSICNTFGTTSVCTTPSPAITLTVTALATSVGTLTALPTPVTTAGQTVVTAQFAGSGGGASVGAPSGVVNFTLGTVSAAALLILDKSASFSTQTGTLTVPTTATPAISPAAGRYLNSVAVTVTDATVGAAIYYTQDGSTPTSSSTLYSGPFQVATTQTVQAVAVASGAQASGVASAAYTITVSTPSKLAFAAQPVSTNPTTVIAPAVQVAIQDASGNTVNNSTLPVTLALANNSTQATLGGTTTVNAVNGIATFADLTVNNVANGYLLVATSGSLGRATSSAFNVTPYPITMAVQSALIGINSTLNGTITLGHAAPVGGLVVTLSSDTPANVTIAPGTLTIAAGQTTGSFTYTGVAGGNATLSASATNYQTGTAQVTGTAAQVSLGTIPTVAPGQAVSLALSLPTVAPAGGTTVTFTSSNTNVATVTQSIMVPAGQRTATTNPQITGVTVGTTNILASAPGYAPDSRAVNVTVTASLSAGSNPIALGLYNTTTLNISAPAQAGGITFTLKSDDTTKATVAATVTIPQGQTSVVVPITGVADGSTTIRADATGVTEATLLLTVNSKIQVSALTTGAHLITSSYYLAYLPATPSGPVDVTLTVSDPSVATISSNVNAVGTATLTLHNVTGSGYPAQIYLQGQSVGTTTLTVSAPGFTSGTATMTVYPSGFSLGTGSFSTTTFSTPTQISLYPSILNPGTLTYYSSGTINPGYGPVSVPVTSSNTGVGTITTSPVVFNGGDSYVYTGLQPTGAGTTTVQLGAAPAGFSAPSQVQSLTATVTAPALQAGALTTGVNMQNTSYYLAYVPVAPPSAVTVTVTISNPAVVTLSKSTTAVGTATLTFPNTTSAGYLTQIYIQGQSVGTATLTVSAPGYTSATSTITVVPSGFTFTTGSTFSTTTFSGVTTVGIYPSMLSSTDLSYAGALTLNPGIASVSLPITSSNTGVATITTSPVVFNGGDSYQATGFQPVGAGTTTIAIARTPAGYSTPSMYQQIATTVTAPVLMASAITTGVKMQNTSYYLAYVPVAPPAQENVTVTVSNPAIATLSKSAGTVGVATLTFPVTSQGYLPQFYVQGQSVGSTTMTVSAPGYTSATSTITVGPSGFTFAGVQSISTSTFSPATAVNVYPSLLNASDLSYNTTLTLNPGIASVSVPITSSNTSTGTITTSPVVFNAGDAGKATSFQPTAAGTSTISIANTPSGYSTPANYTQIAATVTAPQITVGTSSTGVNLESSGGYYMVYLPVAPPNPVTVTLTSNGPSIATISSSATAVGTSTVTFPNVTSAGYLGTIYIQGQGLGTTTLTASAPGYTNGNGTLTVYPSGFSFGPTSSVSTTAGATPTALTVYPYVLNSGSLSLQYSASLNPGSATVAVPVTSSNPVTGVITTSPLLFNAGDASKTTTFQPLVTGTTTLTVQPPAGFSTPSQNQQIPATVQ